MKNVKTYFITFVALVALLLGFTGCSKSEEPKLKLSFDKPVYEMELGSTLEITPNLENGSVDELILAWTSYDENIVKCEDGKLVSVNPGETTVKVEVIGLPHIVAVTKVKVLYENEMPTVTFDEVKKEMLLEETQQLNYTVSTTDVTLEAEYKSLNESVATVSNTGLITAVEEGSTVIVVKLVDSENPERYSMHQFLITVTELVYEVKYEVYGGENSEANPEEYTDRNCPITLEEPTRVGYTFKGWYLDNAYTEEITSIDKGTKKNLTLFAKWEADVYTVKLDTNGGKEISDIEYTIETLGFYFPTPVKTGYTFVKWVDVNTNEERAFVKNGTLENIEVKAEWVPTVYTITYNLNNGVYTGEYVKEYTIEDETITLIVPTRDYYIFNGWCMDELCETEIVTEIPAGSYGDKVYYAKWTPITYYITYEGLQFVDLQQGKNNEENPYKYNVESETITFKEPTRLGYKFLGWYLDAEHTTEITEIKAGSNGDVTIYADWEIIVYNIEYKGVDFTGVSASPDVTNPNETIVTYTVETPTFELEDATRKGYTFKGWNPGKTVARGTTGDLTFEATWEVVEYTITYVDGVQSGSASTTVVNTNPTKYTVEDEVVLVQPTRDGYTFEGWVGTDVATATKDVTIPAGSIENRTFEATWKVIEYTITYVDGVQAGSASTTVVNTNPTKYTVEDEITLVNPTRTGYDFVAWTEGNTISKGTTGDKTFTATWKVVEYAITYVDGVQAGSASTTVENINPTKYTVEDEITLVNPTRTGYDFVAWTEGNTISKGTTGDKTFTATWNVVEYAITYELDGGTNATSNPTKYTVEDSVTLADPSKTGYTFAKWTEGSSITAGTTGAKTFTAEWTINQYTITFDTDGGSSVAAITQDYNTAVTAPSDPTKEGYTFNGWNTTIPATMPAENITVTAQWTINQYTITFDTAGGSAVAAITQDYNTAVTAPSDPTKEGYTFNGWDTTIPATMPAENKTITAKWTAIEYTITYELDGGTNASSNPAKYTIETATFTLADPTKTDYNFGGWYSDAGLTTLANTTIDQGTTGNLAFYAKWESAGVSGYTVEDNGSGVTITATDSAVLTGAITIPSEIGGKQVTAIAAQAFMDNDNITSVTIPNTVTTIGDEAFLSCGKLETVVIPGSVQTIGMGAFNTCTKLTSVTIEDGVETIGNYAFYYCGLSSITLPASLTSIGEYVFDGCSKLENIYVDSSNTSFKDVDGVLYSYNGDTIYKFPEYKYDVTSYSIPEGVKYISKSAFDGATYLQEITLPSTLLRIEERAFSSCKFTSVTIPESVEYVGSKAFYNSLSGGNVTVTNNATSTSSWATDWSDGCTVI